jgi:hypothetical protein
VSTEARKARKRAGEKFVRTPKTPTVTWADRSARRAHPEYDLGGAQRQFFASRMLSNVGNVLSELRVSKRGDR